MNIGISGPIGAGKTTAAKYLASRHGFSYLRYSEVLAEISPQPNPDRKTLREFGWKIMSGAMQATLNQRLISKIQRGTDYVIDGLRHPIDFEALSSRPPFFLIYVDASPQTRWQRLRWREQSTTWEALQASEKHPVESYLIILKEKAHKTLLNEGPMAKLYADLDAVLSEMRR